MVNPTPLSIQCVYVFVHAYVCVCVCVCVCDNSHALKKKKKTNKICYFLNHVWHRNRVVGKHRHHGTIHSRYSRERERRLPETPPGSAEGQKISK